MTATVNRADLAWALRAVLPHVGNWPYDCIGLQASDGELRVSATDSHTAAVARLPFDSNELSWVEVTEGEARDLEKFVRVGRKADEDDRVEVVEAAVIYGYESDLGYSDRELHIGLTRQKGDERVPDSGVFWQRPFGLRTWGASNGLLLTLQAYPERLRTETRAYTFSPSLLARFSKAGKLATDSLRMYPYMMQGKDGTVALVTVGDNFLGAIAGMQHQQDMESTLDSWFGRQEQAA